MPTFEAVADLVLPELCADCPLRNLCGDVETARLDAELDPDSGTDEAVGTTEAHIAANMVLASVYKQRNGCSGAVKHEEACSCGNDSSCGAFVEVVNLIMQAEE